MHYQFLLRYIIVKYRGSMLFSENDINFDTLLDDSVISNLQKMILRITLGVSKRSSRWAITARVGRICSVLGAHPIGNWRTHPEFADAQLTGIN